MILYAKDSIERIEKCGIKKEDIETIIADAGNDKIFNGELFIAKKVICNRTVYAVYKDNGENITVISGYSHKMNILDIVLVGEDTEWKYCLNGAKVKKGHTNLSYLGATRSGPSLVEPISGASWFEEYMSNGALTAAEGLFQQKRG